MLRNSLIAEIGNGQPAAEIAKRCGWRNMPAALVDLFTREHVRQAVAALKATDEPAPEAPQQAQPAQSVVVAHIELRTDEDFRRARPSLWRNALHEAAHAAVANEYGSAVRWALAGNWSDGGACMYSSELSPFGECAASMAGIAVNEICGQRAEDEDASDHAHAREAAKRHLAKFATDFSDDEERIRDTLYEAKNSAMEILSRQMVRVKALARTLYLSEGEKVDGDEIRRILNS